jgi:hypothetical protein
MEKLGAQQLLFQHIKGILPGHLSMVDEIARVLDVSNDSAYRRIRGEKPITLEETKLLCNQFKISLDQLLHLNTDTVVFSGHRADPDNFDFEHYLQDFLKQHQIINSFEKRELLILPKDVPVYHYYNFPELAAFKYFFWMKTILRYPDYSKSNFNPSQLSEKLLKTGEKVLSEYNKIPSTEIWNVENINTTLRQIEYYKQMGVFKSEADVSMIYDCLEKVIDHVEAQAEAGYKSTYNQKGSANGAPLNIYINDFILGDNMYMPILNGNKIVFMTHAFLNYIHTRDVSFAEYTFRHFQNVVNKSTLISQVGERDRISFFNRIRANITYRRQVGVNSY